ncbi:hypothetical protein M3Y97_00447300 [Aphelenchoides bicaudatus]|nr:hypothetical protein M3Y97_00447300 [Aphelenchoides bicaudatus]
MSEELIQRKLIADGHGTNEDRRLLNLFTNIYSLESNPDDLATLSKIETALSQAEVAFEKHLIVADTCNRDADQIREFMRQVESDIAKLRQRIEEIKEELVNAKLVRKNRQEYDGLAKLINGKPSRPESTSSLAKVELEIKELHDQQKELEAKLMEKRKNMYALAVLLSDLDATIDDGDTPTIAQDQQMEDGEEADDSDQEPKP